jgi:hypothetical protein
LHIVAKDFNHCNSESDMLGKCPARRDRFASSDVCETSNPVLEMQSQAQAESTNL